MDMRLKKDFLAQWDKHFNGNELPFTLMYRKDPGDAEKISFDAKRDCLLSIVSLARSGRDIYINADSTTCSGAKQSLGFEAPTESILSQIFSHCHPTGNNGNHPKKDHQKISEWIGKHPRIEAPKENAVFKRWDRLEEQDNPQVVIFFADPNELSALFTLANCDESSPYAVNAPFCTGCAALTMFPLQESYSNNPQPVLGMLDVSTRPYVPQTTMSFAVPFDKFKRMVDNMDQSFLQHDTWRKAQFRLTYPSAQRYHRLRCHI